MPQITPLQLQRGTPHVDAAAGTRSEASTVLGPKSRAAQPDTLAPEQLKPFSKGNTLPSSFACYTDTNDNMNHTTTRQQPRHQKSKPSVFVKIATVGLAIMLAGLLLMEALIASDWWLVQASSCGKLSMIPMASVETFPWTELQRNCRLTSPRFLLPHAALCQA